MKRNCLYLVDWSVCPYDYLSFVGDFNNLLTHPLDITPPSFTLVHKDLKEHQTHSTLKETEIFIRYLNFHTLKKKSFYLLLKILQRGFQLDEGMCGTSNEGLPGNYLILIFVQRFSILIIVVERNMRMGIETFSIFKFPN